VIKIACSDFSSFALGKAKNFNLLLQNSKYENLSLLSLTEPDRNFLLSWGWGEHGVLGLGDFTDRNVPTITELVSHAKEIKDI